MSRSSVVVAAVVLAALFAGLLWYQLAVPSSNTATPAPTSTSNPIIAVTPVATLKPTPTIVPNRQPRITPEGARSVNPSAKTGPAEDMATLAALLVTLGGGGLAYAIKRV